MGKGIVSGICTNCGATCYVGENGGSWSAGIAGRTQEEVLCKDCIKDCLLDEHWEVITPMMRQVNVSS